MEWQTLVKSFSCVQTPGWCDEYLPSYDEKSQVNQESTRPPRDTTDFYNLVKMTSEHSAG